MFTLSTWNTSSNLWNSAVISTSYNISNSFFIHYKQTENGSWSIPCPWMCCHINIITPSPPFPPQKLGHCKTPLFPPLILMLTQESRKHLNLKTHSCVWEFIYLFFFLQKVLNDHFSVCSIHCMLYIPLVNLT